MTNDEFRACSHTRVHDFYDATRNAASTRGGIDARIGPRLLCGRRRLATEVGWCRVKGTLTRVSAVDDAVVSRHIIAVATNSVSLDPTLKDAWADLRSV